jgi:hypothetical protein
VPQIVIGFRVAIPKGICNLTETDAGLIEPAITEFQKQLHRFWTFCDVGYGTELFVNTSRVLFLRFLKNISWGEEWPGA